MGYVKKTLAPGEDYIYRAHFNWTYDFKSWFWFVLGCTPIAIWLAGFVMAGGAAPSFGAGFYGIGGAAFLLGLAILTARYVHRWTTVIAVTSVRLILKSGLVSRETHEVSLDKIEEVLMHQPFLGRILGYGVLTIRGTGIAVIEFPVLGQPMEIRRELETAVVRSRKLVKKGEAQK